MMHRAKHVIALNGILQLISQYSCFGTENKTVVFLYSARDIKNVLFMSLQFVVFV